MKRLVVLSIGGLAGFAGTVLAWAFSLGMKWGLWDGFISTRFWGAFHRTSSGKRPGKCGTSRTDVLRFCRTIREKELPFMWLSTSQNSSPTTTSRNHGHG